MSSLRGNSTTDPPTSEHDKIFNAAIDKYKKLTGITGEDSLAGTPFTSKLDNFTSTHAAINLLRVQVQAFDEFRKGNKILMAWLESIVDLLFMLSKKLEESPQAVSPEGFFIPISWYYGTSFIAILPRKNDLCCCGSPPRCRSFPWITLAGVAFS